ncbi:unnamed protein product [Peronospora belbahrii]|uniref:BED-type domain-containing protein n=1 Tax=Peronospora belbahrii TaxID=622444 RepID=A0AAU9KYV6_9STRA|nr:unnamed protein product [Peronospora belbahrii]CAH0517106.1 unnamed protein product [Peronospora belbahrii]
MKAEARVMPMNVVEEIDDAMSLGKVSTLTSAMEQVDVTTGEALFDLSSYTGGAPLMPTRDNGTGNVVTGSPSATVEMFDQDIGSTQHLVDKYLDGDDKKMGRPSHPAWRYFVRGEKRNRFHYNAYCRLCSENGIEPVPVRGVSGNMIRHLQKCSYCPDEVVTQLKLLCAQKDAANFNKRHQSHNPSVDMLLQETSLAPKKKTRRSQDPDSAAVLPSTAGEKDSGAQDKVQVEDCRPLQLSSLSSERNIGLSSMSSSKPLVYEQNLSASNKPGKLDKPGSRSTTKTHGKLCAPQLHRPSGLRMNQSVTSGIDADALSKLVMSSSLSTGLPWDWIWTEQAALLFGHAHSKIELPSAERLTSMGAMSHEKQIMKMKDEQIGITLAVNWWVAKYPRSSFVLISLVNALGEAATWELYDTGIEDSALESLAEKIRISLTDLRGRGIHVINIVAEPALAYAAARLAVASSEWTSLSIPVLPCFSHLLQVLLGVVMTESNKSVRTIGEVIEIIRIFSNHRVLRVLRRECGDPDVMLHAPTRLNWYSFIEAVDSVRQYEDMIKIIASKVAQASSDPRDLAGRSLRRSLTGNLRKDSVGNTVDELIECGLSSRVIRTILNPEFWENVMALSELMSPLKETYEIMSSAFTMSFSLSDVFYQLGRMQQQYRIILTDREDTAGGRRSVEQVRFLLQKINDMWKLYDQQLMVLGYTFNYNLQHPLFARHQPSLQWLSIGKYAKQYFREWFCAASLIRNPSRLLALSDEAIAQFMEDILAFKERKYPFDSGSMCDFDNPRLFYMLVSDSRPLMHMFGSRLFSFMTSTPPLSNVVPRKCFIPSASSATCPQQTLLPLLRMKLFAQTALRPSKDMLGFLQSNRPKGCMANRIISGDMREPMSEADIATSPILPSFSTDGRVDVGEADETLDRIWSEREWTAMAKDWKTHWEKETDASSLLQTPGVLDASTPSLALDQIFKEKLPSRLRHDQEDAAVDV